MVRRWKTARTIDDRCHPTEIRRLSASTSGPLLRSALVLGERDLQLLACLVDTRPDRVHRYPLDLGDLFAAVAVDFEQHQRCALGLVQLGEQTLEQHALLLSLERIRGGRAAFAEALRQRHAAEHQMPDPEQAAKVPHPVAGYL